jgi:hypothetical protein
MSHEPAAVGDPGATLLEVFDGPFPVSTGYGRVDLADGTDGLPLVLELELVEPSLFSAARQPLPPPVTSPSTWKASRDLGGNSCWRALARLSRTAGRGRTTVALNAGRD